MLRIAVCRECGWTDSKIREELKALEKEHPGRLEIVKKDCLDECKRDPVVRVGKKMLAPARRKKLRQAVEKRLAAE